MFQRKMAPKSSEKMEKCRVFWDLESVPIPKNVSANQFMGRFRTFVLDLCNLSDQTFYAVCDVKKVAQNQLCDKRFFDSFRYEGGCLINIDYSNLNAVQKMSDLMRYYVSKHGGKNVVIIANHDDYVDCIKSLSQQGAKIYLVNQDMENTSRKLVQLAHRCFNIDTQQKGKVFFWKYNHSNETSHKPSSIPNKPIVLKTDNFYKNITDDLRTKFEETIKESGGLIVTNPNNNSNPIWIVYSDYNKALKGLTLINDYDINNSDFKIRLHPIYEENPPKFLLKLNLKSLDHLTTELVADDHVYVKVNHSFNKDLIQQFMEIIVPVLNGSIEKYDDTSMLIKLKFESDAEKLIAHLNSLKRKTSSGHINAKIVPSIFLDD